MDRNVMTEHLSEKRAIWPLPNFKKRILFLNNCGGHNKSADSIKALQELRTTVHFLPPNSTHLTQPADSILIQKIKDEWRRRWDAYKLRMIKEGNWKDGAKSSGKLVNPGKRYFLQLPADCVKAVNSMKGQNGLSWARKAMIRCGLSLGLD
jgi:DDE superfamily endonuclease